ncbi:MAG TPA: hypothetical protein VGD50_05570, partial [Candidatus Baltobacteraceae bacterium]
MFRFTVSRRLTRVASVFLATTYVFGLAVPTCADPLETFSLPDKRIVNVLPGGTLEITDKKTHSVRRLSIRQQGIGIGGYVALPNKAQLMAQLLQKPAGDRGYAPGRVIVVYRDTVFTSADSFRTTAEQLAGIRAAKAAGVRAVSEPAYTSDSATNQVLSALGVVRQDRLFTHIARSIASAAYSRRTPSDEVGAAAASLNPANAYRLDVSGSNVHDAVLALLRSPNVVYASPEWTVSSMRTPNARVLPASQEQHALQEAWRMPKDFGRALSASAATTASSLPTNYGLTSSNQSLLNAPGVDVAAAYDLIARQYGQLPGTGETITNVSLGDLDDASETDPNDPCTSYQQNSGPTTVVKGGQRYIDWPSMPLIPTYTADASGTLNGLGAVCGVDPSLGEI